jgi:hypothetical protein
MHMHECMYVEESSGLYCTDVIRYDTRKGRLATRPRGFCSRSVVVSRCLIIKCVLESIGESTSGYIHDARETPKHAYKS